MAVYSILIETYPNAAALARADEEALRQLLRPLGLYAKRATQLRGLGEALSSNDLSLLEDPEVAERTLPGIGAYGARAIACFAFGRSVGIVDANVIRIFDRVFAHPKVDPRSRRYQTYADRVARYSPDAKASNYGLLDIGSAICVRTPKCSKCPLNNDCRYAKGEKQRFRRHRPTR
ncbi:MAG: hypothetical protein M3N13_03240 [Candidatus Eremiobacteraeota bacterium]|nr:hypothetical protein [Candidatus Eremiobacteraeota bacterium]